MSDSPLIFANPAPSRLRFSVGAALQATLDALGANLGPMVVLALIIVGVPNLLAHLVNANLHYRVAIDPLGRAWGPATFVMLTVNFLTGILLDAAVTRVVVTYLNRGRPRIADSLSSIAQVFLPLLGIALLSGLSMVVGFVVILIPAGFAWDSLHLTETMGPYAIFLIVPFMFIPVVFLWVLWSVAGPAEVIEGRGVIGSLRRSYSLTAKHRWATLGVLATMMLLGLVLSLIGAGLQTLANMLLIAGGLFGAGVSVTLTSLVNAVITSISGVFGAAARAAIYSVLRQAKEGVSPQSLASVFD